MAHKCYFNVRKGAFPIGRVCGILTTSNNETLISNCEEMFPTN